MEMNSVPDALDLKGVTMRYRGGVTAVDDVSLSITQGEVVALLGPNGAGKTTLIDIALGLQHPTAGSANLLGMSPPGAISRGLIGVVNQTGALPVDFSVHQLLTLFSGFYATPLSLVEVVEATNLGDLVKRKIRKLSGGEQQRVRLALALLPDPLVMFLDEPTAGMDPTARQDFWRVIKKAAGTGRTVIFATHYLAEAEAFAERTIIMRDGRVAVDSPTHALMRRGTARLTIDLDEGEAAGVRASLEERGWTALWEEGRLVVSGSDLDDAARILLAVPGAHNLRLVDASLEDIFASITGVKEGPQE